MQEKQLFEYAVIRVVPRADREEFMNVGVIVYCAAKKFLQLKYVLDEEKLRALSSELDLGALKKQLQAFEWICLGLNEGGPIAKLPTASRFRWLTATRSTIVQVSPVHAGFCSKPEEAVEKLYAQMVE